MTVDEILADYENLEGESILAALDYAGNSLFTMISKAKSAY
jgi:uncharacterized protein (DUF433 family)